jgi:hypothetical protein
MQLRSNTIHALVDHFTDRALQEIDADPGIQRMDLLRRVTVLEQMQDGRNRCSRAFNTRLTTLHVWMRANVCCHRYCAMIVA